MRSLRLAILILLALPATARAEEATLVTRDLPVAGARTLASARAPDRFNLVGLHWQGPGRVSFRTRSLSGRWSVWRAAAPEAEDAPDPGSSEGVRSGRWKLGNPYWTGASDRIQYRLRGRVSRLRAHYVWSPVGDSAPRAPATAATPAIVPRTTWRANELIRRGAPRYSSTVRYAVVHHSAGSNSYTREQSAAVVRAIQVYHVRGNGWDDIGYNFLVDRYGQVFEGRFGGVERNVIGAHAQGFNTGSVGVALLGNYNSVALSTEARSALVRLLAWRLDVAHVDPLEAFTMPSGGNPRYPSGVPVFLRPISGHRDVGFTSCPGSVVYSQLNLLGRAVSVTGLPKLYAPAATPAAGRIRFTGRLSSSIPWTVTVTDPVGTQVATGGGFGPRVDWTWDARGVPAGRYSWAIRAGTTLRPATGTLLAGGGAALTLSSVSASPTTVSPNGDGFADSTTIRYTLGAPATVTATVLDGDGLALATLFSEPKPVGAQSFSWLPDALPDGSYTRADQREDLRRPRGRLERAGLGQPHVVLRFVEARLPLAERRRPLRLAARGLHARRRRGRDRHCAHGAARDGDPACRSLRARRPLGRLERNDRRRSRPRRDVRDDGGGDDVARRGVSGDEARCGQHRTRSAARLGVQAPGDALRAGDGDLRCGRSQAGLRPTESRPVPHSCTELVPLRPVACPRSGRKRRPPAQRAAAAAQASYASSSCSSSSASSSARLSSRPAATESEPAGVLVPVGSSSADTLTFTPMPSTTRPSRASARIPATLRPSTSTSFGCLIVGVRPVRSGDRLRAGLAGDERQLRQAGGGDRWLEQHRDEHAGAGSGLPGAAEPAPSFGLLLGHRHGALGGVVEEPLRRLGPLDVAVVAAEPPAQERGDGLGREEITHRVYTRPALPPNLTTPLGRTEIEAILPHREPFLLIDEVLELEPGKRVVARKLVRPDEWYLTGHFPGRPVMPGVLIVEAMAQTGAVAVLSEPENAGKMVLFAGIDNVRFKRIVEPGDELELICELERVRGPIGRGVASARVDGELAARGTLTFAVEQ